MRTERIRKYRVTVRSADKSVPPFYIEIERDGDDVRFVLLNSDGQITLSGNEPLLEVVQMAHNLMQDKG